MNKIYRALSRIFYRLGMYFSMLSVAHKGSDYSNGKDRSVESFDYGTFAANFDSQLYKTLKGEED